MKKLFSLCLAVGLAISMLSITGFARVDEADKYVELDHFTIEEGSAALAPGQDYYFPCKWESKPMRDDFFHFYNVTVSVGSRDKEEMSTLEAAKYIEKAEFVKIGDTYYFHLRPARSYSIDKDAKDEYKETGVRVKEDKDVRINVRATDKADKYRRGNYELFPQIGYDDANTNAEVLTNRFEVESTESYLEFDKSIKTATLLFGEGSYLDVDRGGRSALPMGYNQDENLIYKTAYPKANLKFLTFYGNPKFADGSMKLYAPSTGYLYQIGADNGLTLISNQPSKNFYTFAVNALGSYVASSVPLSSMPYTVIAGKGITQLDPTVSTPPTQPTAPGTTETPAVPSNPTQPVNPETGCAA